MSKDRDFKIATYNAKSGVHKVAQDLHRLIKEADVINLQEMGRANREHIMKEFRAKGWGFYWPTGDRRDHVPIMYKKSEFELVAGHSKHLSDKKFVGDRGPGPSVWEQKYANIATLRHKGTGKKMFVINAHAPVPGKNNKLRNDLYHHFMKNLDKVVSAHDDDLVFVGGDFNRNYKKDRRGIARPERMLDLRSTYKELGGATDKGTHGQRHLDYLMTHRGKDGVHATGEYVLGHGAGLHSDHRALIAGFSFGNKKGGHVPRPDHKPPKGKPHRKPGDNAFQTFMGLLDQMGFHHNADIAKEVRKMVLDGITDFSQIELGLRDTKSWKERFAGNEMRVKSGLNALSVSEYLSTEKSYADLLHQAGLPTGFYDDPHDFADFIGKSVSASELSSRIQMATDLKNREDPNILAELRRRGMSEGDIIAHFLDADRAAPLLAKKYQSVLIGAAARRAGANTSTDYADHLASLGVTEQQAASGYGTVADITHTLKDLGNLYGEDYNQSDAEAEVFENSADAAKKRRRLSGQESAAFSGSSGTSQASVGRDPAGSY